jgi:hypothetical protein
MRFSLFLIPALIVISNGCKSRNFNVESKKGNDTDKIQGNECVRQLAKWESEANGVSPRESTLLKLKNYEIPAELVESDVSETTPPEIQKAFFFQKDGKKYVRWLIQPEDSKWYKEVETFLQTKTGKTPTAHEYFNGYLTASRSVIVTDPESGYSFSLKASTNKTAGKWSDKKQQWEDGKDIRAVSDYVARLQKKLQLKNAVILQEPMAFGIKDVDQSNVIRLLGEAATCDKYYLPGFSALHEKVGKELAGKEEPVEFWNNAYAKPLGRALAEFAGIWGLSFDSPHSQNFLIELDKSKKPTGRIILRDLGDVFVLKEQTELLDAQNVASRLNVAHNLKSGQLNIAVGLLHGNVPPTWVNDEQYKTSWGQSFFSSFEKEYSTLTGFDLSTIAPSMSALRFSYVSKVYSINSGWKTSMNSFASCVNTGKSSQGACPAGLTERMRK